ncbi:hypothetical protein J3B02_005719 [Coemansia erecta]|nr:hypothetical protein J3B02_005719 [Coemansia erecta]
MPELLVARTPAAQGRFTEYSADLATSASINGDSPVTKGSRSSTLPSLEQQQQELGNAKKANANAVAGRQVRSARAPRKKVHFPGEQELKTILTYDPHIVQPNKDKTGGLTCRSSSPPPLVKPGTTFKDNSDDDDNNSDHEAHGLAAKVRSSPRLTPRSSSITSYQRPPIPRANNSNGTQAKASFLPTHLLADDSGDDLVQGRASDAHTLDFTLQADVAMDPLPKQHDGQVVKTNWRGLHVGPNTASAQSSPVAAGVVVTSSNISSSPSPGSEADRTVFGAEQIPSIARGRNTAFKQVF